jgi:site-specific DNA-methyltransferase (adenine-specific)
MDATTYNITRRTEAVLSAPVSIARNVAQCGDALALLRLLPDSCARQGWFDPQHRSVLNKLKYGNEGERQRGRARLPQMSDEYIDECCSEFARVLKPSGYLMLWADTYRLGEGYHLRIRDYLRCVGICAWDNERPGQGKRFRHCGDYVIALQKKPLRASATWFDHGIRSRWRERVDRKLHPHAKPIGLIKRLIAATTQPGDLICDPAAGSFTVMHAARQLERQFVGCDLAHGVGS